MAGEHRRGNDPWYVRLRWALARRLSRVWKALGGFVGASAATFLPVILQTDWSQRAAVHSLMSGIFTALIVYFFPSNGGTTTTTS